MYALKRITFTARRYHPRMMYITPGDFWMSRTFLTRPCGKTSETRPPPSSSLVCRAEAREYIRYFSITLPTIFTNPLDRISTWRATCIFVPRFFSTRGLNRLRKFFFLHYFNMIIFHNLMIKVFFWEGVIEAEKLFFRRTNCRSCKFCITKYTRTG